MGSWQMVKGLFGVTHGGGVDGLGVEPGGVGEGGDFGGFDFGASAPEDVGVGDLEEAAFGAGEVGVDGGLVGEDHLLVGAVGDAHDVDVVEFGAALAPVGVGHDVE